MGGIFGGKPKAPDNSEQLDELRQQREDREEDKDKVERENRARRRSVRARRSGFRSLLFDDERGVTSGTLG